MIKFFRKIRYNLLNEGKTTKYFKYAIGEIILVVIGILIALSINNWNEQRKTTNVVKGIYAIIKGDLAADISTINGVLEGSKHQDSVFKTVINREITYNDYIACGSCTRILGGFPDIKLKSRGLTLLEENSAFLNAKQDSLSLKIIDFYDFYITEIDVAIDEVIKDYNENRSYFKTNMPWFSDYDSSVFNEDLINYELTSIDYRNRVVSFYNLYYNGYLNYLEEYKVDAQHLIETINKNIE